MNGIIQYNCVVGENHSLVEFGSKIYEGFYISYNSYDANIYGCDTTALVLGQMQKFYILNGDHRKQYREIIEQGFEKCMLYFKGNIHCVNKYSDKLQDSN